MPYASNPSDDARIYYEVLGDGPAVLMHYGFSRSLLEWHPDYTGVLSSNFRLILIDARGHGRSSKSTDADAYVMPNRVADVCAVLDAAEATRAHYVGYSMGGQVGFGMARYARERLLSLAVGGMHPWPPEGAAADRSGFARSLAEGMPAHVARMEANLGAALPEPFRSELLANDAQALAAVAGAPRDTTLHEGLAGFDLPILLYCGTKDGVIDGARRAAEPLPNAELVELDGLDHLAAVMRADLAAPHLANFLRRNA